MSTIRERITEAKAHELLTVEQVALLTQYSEKSIYRKAALGEIPGIVRFGRGLRFDRTIVLGWHQRRAARQPPDIQP